jgi:hypothetical protein
VICIKTLLVRVLTQVKQTVADSRRQYQLCTSPSRQAMARAAGDDGDRHRIHVRISETDHVTLSPMIASVARDVQRSPATHSARIAIAPRLRRTGDNVTATMPYETAADHRDGVSPTRLLWVGPLTVIVAFIVNQIIKTIAIALNPSLADMGQLGRSLIVLTLEGAILAVIVFALMVWLVPHPIRWFRIVAVIAWLISLIPDLLLGLGGDARRVGSAMVAPFSRFGALFFPAAPSGGRPSGGPSPGETLPGLPWDRVLLLMLLHTATFLVCVVLLTTLTREPENVERRTV